MTLTPGYQFTDEEEITAAKLNQLGTPTPALEEDDYTALVPPPLAQTRQLVLYNSAATLLTATAADVVLVDAAAGTAMATGTLSETISSGASGAGGVDTGGIANNTWYYVWIVSNGSAINGLLSVSNISPTMPAAYTFKGLIGVAYFASGAWRDFKQHGNHGVQDRAYFVDDNAVAADTWEACDTALVAAAIPPNAIGIGGTIFATVSARVGVGAKNADGWAVFAEGTEAPYWLHLFNIGGLLADPEVFFRCSDNTTVLAVDCMEYELHA